MITQWTAGWGKFRRALSRNEWAVRWLGLPRDVDVTGDRGLILIQIDGLSRCELQRALDQGELPFLQKLIQHEHYHLHSLYSGLPSSTPSVQGELFYGPSCAVPAFGFKDHRTGQLVRMFDRDAARRVQERLEEAGPGILAGGSAYCAIYDGGAAEAHFCATHLGWDEVVQSANPLKLLSVLVCHMASFLRTLGLLMLESVLAVGGFLRGVLTGHELWQELMMIPARVVVVILLRELSTIGAAMDIARGLPSIHINFLGYDEQAHRRGPDSRFAHWTLKGIDHAIRRVWNAAHRGARRHYDVWVYADHGQEPTKPYEYVAKQTIRDAVAEVVDGVNTPVDQSRAGDPARPGEWPDGRRARWLSAGRLVGMLFGEGPVDSQRSASGVQVQAIGPLGLIYTNRPCTVAQRESIARRLVTDKHVPLVVIAATPNSATAFTADGQYRLPDDAASVFGADHPFAESLGRDLVELCHHPDAGDLVISGWRRSGQSLSFVRQYGAHAGPGRDETGAFAMLPADTELPTRAYGYLRPADLREAARRFFASDAIIAQRPAPLASSSSPPPIQPGIHHGVHAAGTDAPPAGAFRVMTYNVHSCVGMDGQLSPSRIARVIAQSRADLVALQELDVSRARTGHRDQAHEIARHLQMHYHFHPALRLKEEQYGDAILSRFPLQVVKSDRLPASHDRRETRGAIWVEVSLPNGTIQLLNTHLSIYPGERYLQAEAILTHWVEEAARRGPVVLCGDFNAFPGAPSYRILAGRLHDVQKSVDRGRPVATWFSPRPLARIDHIFTTPDFRVAHADVIRSRLARVASDHLPLIADLKLNG